MQKSYEEETLLTRLMGYWNDVFIRSVFLSSLLFTAIGIGITFIPVVNIGFAASLLSTIGVPLTLAGPFVVLGSIGLIVGLIIGAAIGLALSRRAPSPRLSLKNQSVELYVEPRLKPAPSEELRSNIELELGGEEPEVEELKEPELAAIISPEQIAEAVHKLELEAPAYGNKEATPFFEAIARYIQILPERSPKIQELGDIFSSKNKNMLPGDRFAAINKALENFSQEELDDEKMKPLVTALAKYKIAVLNKLNEGTWSISSLLKACDGNYKQLLRHIDPQEASSFFKKFREAVGKINISKNRPDDQKRLDLLHAAQSGMDNYLHPEKRQELLGDGGDNLDSLGSAAVTPALGRGKSSI